MIISAQNVADINECVAENRYCVDIATCVNTIGNFTCICPLRFIGDGRTRGTGCQGINIL